MDKRICVICGKEYQPIKGKQKTCLDKECQKELHRRYVREHNKELATIRGMSKKDYKREMMRKYREEARQAKQKKESGTKLKHYCVNCDWRDYDQVDGVCACVNPRSPKCAEVVTDRDGCEVWE